MSFSGMKVNDDCRQRYNDMKIKNKEKGKYVVFKVKKDQTEIEVDKKLSDKDSDIATLASEVGKKKGRYIVYDRPCKGKSGQETSKLGLISWCSDNAPVRWRMVYSSSLQALKTALDIYDYVPQCHDFDELREVLEKESE